MYLRRLLAGTASGVESLILTLDTGQPWNHTFYWHSLKPNGGGEPPATLKRSNANTPLAGDYKPLLTIDVVPERFVRGCGRHRIG